MNKFNLILTIMLLSCIAQAQNRAEADTTINVDGVVVIRDTVSCGVFEWGGTTYTGTGQVMESYTTADGRDSLVIMNYETKDLPVVNPLQGRDKLVVFTFGKEIWPISDCAWSTIIYTDSVEGALEYKWFFKNFQFDPVRPMFSLEELHYATHYHPNNTPFQLIENYEYNNYVCCFIYGVVSGVDTIVLGVRNECGWSYVEKQIRVFSWYEPYPDIEEDTQWPDVDCTPDEGTDSVLQIIGPDRFLTCCRDGGDYNALMPKMTAAPIYYVDSVESAVEYRWSFESIPSGSPDCWTHFHWVSSSRWCIEDKLPEGYTYKGKAKCVVIAFVEGTTKLKLEVVKSDGTSVFAEKEITCISSLTDVPEVEATAEDMLEVHPNPTDGTFTIVADDIRTVEVFNQLGQRVITDRSGSRTVNASGLPAGIYFLKVETATATKYGKLMKK